MGSKTGARVLLVVGFLAAWIGYDAWLTAHVILDPNTTRAAAHALLQSPAVQRGIADDITTKLDKQLPGATKNPRVASAVKTALRDPRVTNAFADTIARIHQEVLAEGKSSTFTIDGRAITGALHDALARSDPKLAAQIKQVPPLTVGIGTGKLPHLHDPRSTADVIAVLGIIAALLFITASLILRPGRASVALVGRRIAYLAITPLVVFLVLPRLLAHASGDAPQVAAALLNVYGHRVLPSAIALVIAGLAVFVGAYAVPRSRADGSRSARPPEPPRPPAAPRGAGPGQTAITEKLYL